MEQTELGHPPNYLRVIWENWYKVVAGTLICALAGLVFTLLAPPTYQSTVTLLLYPPLFKEVEQPPVRRTPEQAQLELAELMPRTLPVETYRIIAKSEELIKSVIDKLELEDASVEEIGENLQVELVQLGTRSAGRGVLYSQTIVFHAQAKSPKLAADLAQTWADKFKDRVDNLAKQGLQETYKLVNSMWKGTKERLEGAEDELKKFKEEWNLDLMKAEKLSKETLLTTLDEQLDQTEIDIASASAELAALQGELKDEEPIETLSRAPPESPYWIVKKLSSTSGEAPITPQDVLITEQRNPVYTTARNDEIATQKRLQGLVSEKEKLTSKVGELRGEIGQLQMDIALQETVHKRLERDVTTFESTYTLVASKLEKGKIAKASLTSDMQIAGNAVEPGKPTGTRRLFKVAAAALVGALLGMAYVVADYSIRASPSVAATPRPSTSEG